MVSPTVLGISWKKQLWHRWKSLRNVPLRKTWFVGYDLDGNTYWEMVDYNNKNRLRRKIEIEKPYFFFGQFKPHPMWIQWLNYNRSNSPQLQDLVEDAQRLHRLKLLSQQAEQRWKSVPLKSNVGTNLNDPRIGTAWTGANTPLTPETPLNSWEEQGSTSHNFVSSNAHEKNEMMLAMKKAESQNSKQPEVLRDRLGQVTVTKARKT